MNKAPRTTFSISIIITLAVLWFLLSGYTTPLLLGLGAASTLFVLYLSVRMGLLDEEGLPVRVRLRALINYTAWLIDEIIKANIDVTRQVMARKLQLDPVVVRLPAKQSTVIGRVIYANSITLTPGTVSIELSEDSVDVHALSREAATELAGGEMHDRVCAVEVTDRV